jgi:hypothetical protein
LTLLENWLESRAGFEPYQGGFLLHYLDALAEIGRLQEYLSETECKINGERLDVAWRRVAASVPQKVFEVQVSGNLYSAIGKLKKAHVYWNTILPELVTYNSSSENFRRRCFGVEEEKISDPSYWVLTGDRENWRRGPRCKASQAD